MERLAELAVAPLSLVDRFRQEVGTMVDEGGLPAGELLQRIDQLRGEIHAEGETRFGQFVKEADAVEQELLGRLDQVRELRERAELIRGLISSMFRSKGQ
ncbi:MAG: hypothetical protein ACE5HK_04410 [Candidatus Methylomirabilales bacterium]